jgi:hypothetical protein
VIPIGEAFFRLDAPDIDDEALQRYAAVLFKGFDASASNLPLSDYGLALDIEEGSIRGKGVVLTTAAALYFGIGAFGDFVQGVREIGQLTKPVVDQLISDAPKKLGRPNALTWKRSDTAALARLERLFAAVKSGALEPAEATRRAIALLSEVDALPESMVKDMATSIECIVLDPKQFDLLPPLQEESSAELLNLHGPDKRRPRPGKHVLPSRKLRVELRKTGRKGETILRVVVV